MAWRIVPICVGVFPHIERSSLLFGIDPGIKMEAPVLMWLLKDTETGENIIVDTGSSDPDWAYSHHHGLLQPPEQDPVQALEREGVDPRTVRTVINTHLHWDHSWNNHLFPHARIVVQRDEAGYATAPYDIHRVFYERTGEMTPPWLASLNQMDFIEGDVRLRPGLDVVHLPGHTPGSQGVLVQGQHQSYLIAGDCIGLKENWEGIAGYKHVPSGIHVNLTEYYKTFRKMEGIVEAHKAGVLPSHDMRVLEREIYE